MVHAHANIGGHSGSQLNGVLDKAADVPTRFVSCKCNHVSSDVNVRQPKQMGQIAVSGVVVDKVFAWAQSQGINADLERVAPGASCDIGLATDGGQLAIERRLCREWTGCRREAGARPSLVAGCGYEHVGPTPGPADDGRLLAGALLRVGFGAQLDIEGRLRNFEVGAVTHDHRADIPLVPQVAIKLDEDVRATGTVLNRTPIWRAQESIGSRC